MKIYLPYRRLFFGTIISIIPLYFDFPYLLIGFILINSILIGANKNICKALIFYLILTFLIPLDFLTLSTKSEVGLIINEYFFAGIPLYFCLPFILRSKKYRSDYIRSQKFILYPTIILLFLTNIIPGLLSLIGLGGYSIRLIFVFNFVNALIVFYFMSRLPIKAKLIKDFSSCLITLGFVISLLGICQYFFHVSIIPNIEYVDFSRLSILNMNNAVDSFPYLLVPFIIAFARLIYSKAFSYKLLFANLIMFAAMVLTFSRWGLFVVMTLIIITLWDNRKKFMKIAFVTLISLSCLSPILISIGQNALDSKEQGERLSSAGNLYVRVYLWGLAATAIYDNPYGYGFGNSTEAMFSKESEFFLLKENSFNSVDTFQRQSVHQFFLDYMMSLGALFGLILLLLFGTLLRESIAVTKIAPGEIRYFYIAIKLITIALFIFYIQNIGPQIFYLFLFLGFFRNNLFYKLRSKTSFVLC
jgi:hypothetical protein